MIRASEGVPFFEGMSKGSHNSVYALFASPPEGHPAPASRGSRRRLEACPSRRDKKRDALPGAVLICTPLTCDFETLKSVNMS